MSILYAKSGKLYCNEYIEIYIPTDYFEDEFAVDSGQYIQTIGILYIRAYKDGVPGKFQILNIPTIINLMVYNSKPEEINIDGKSINVITLKYLKDAYVLHQFVQKGREVAEYMLAMMLMGKLPKSIEYSKIINIWWRNLEISGVDFKVPSKIYEMIIASIYRNPNNIKERFGQYYGKQNNPNGNNYKTNNVRNVVEGISTFAGMAFEDINQMLTTGVNNSMDGIEEPISPLEKIIYY